MIHNKSINKPYEKPLQYFLSEEEFVRFMYYIIKTKKNKKSLSREAVLYYLNILDQNEEQNTDGAE